ncbi:MAG: UvrB/UvrC motif-containing protein, partial [Desulfobacterales bacterium]|nr:UvrB/UvrC motif-containing protein [Desulfobacterales bacterium]
NCKKLATVPLELEEEPLLRKDFPRLIEKLEKEMYSAARNLEFEKAAELRDRIKKIREKDLMITA